jgi:hypothetical protein
MQLDTETNVTEHYTLRELCNTTWYLRSRRTAHIDVKDMSTGVDKLLRKLFADKDCILSS